MGIIWYCNSRCFGLSNQILIHSRHLSVGCAQLAIKNALSKQGKIFNKFLDGSPKKKRKIIFENSSVLPSADKLSLGYQLNYNKENYRRIAVLNSLFMKHISDLLVTGNIGVDLLSKGLEISRVSINSNFNQLNVFWGSHSEQNIVELENILPEVSYTLRHELSQLRVVGVVPRILFVKDKNFSNGAKVDYLLRIADFGEDHIPQQLESDFKDVSPTTRDKNQTPSNEKEKSEMSTLEDEETMPVMRHDIFNLDHQLIMKKIMRKMQKSRAIHRFEPNLAIKSDGHGVTDISDMPTDTKEERKEALAKFILSRKILLEKKNQNKNQFDKEIHVLQQNNNGNDEDEDFEVEDYIEEEFEEKKFEN